MKMKYAVVCAALCGAGWLTGCGEALPDEEVSQEERTRSEAVSVVPHFQIMSAYELPEQLHIESLGFMVSEIRLEPMAGRDSDVAYSAVRPFEVRFDVASGELNRSGDAIELPREGRYLVSLRLEPVEYRTELGVKRTPSFMVSGYVEGADEKEFVSSRKGDQFIGPIPVPVVDEDGGDDEGDGAKPGGDGEDYVSSSGIELTEDWTPFTYKSDQSVFLPINEVEFGPGENVLTFDFDMGQWAFNIVGPLSSAVGKAGGASPNANGGVDVSSQMESGGYGAESFMDGGRASTMPR